MNIVFLSPHFPNNYYQFCTNLSYLGANVLGLADEPYDLLNPKLKKSLREYYKVKDMHNYDELLRALGYFTHRFGKIDRLDSLNEYWLETEAQLRTDFNIPGLHNDDILQVKRKSLMKQVFRKAGIPVARGRVVQTIDEVKRLVNQTGYPVVAKPDIGVGAAKTFKINNARELQNFFDQKPAVDYIVEEYVKGTICTFDGLTDRTGTPVFYTSHQYSQGVMEVVNNDDDIYYYSLREIPPDLEEIGLKTLRAFNVCERFFHFEFFRSEANNKIIALEVNMRPPGGMTTDMFNYANNIDIYAEWAHILIHNRFTEKYNRPYHCCYIGRKNNHHYEHTHGEVLDYIGERLCHHEQVSGIFSAALGDYGYLVRSPDLDEIHDMAGYIHQRNQY
jgi:biotin carboxylase